MVKFALAAAVVVGVALFFISMGIGNLWSSDKRDKEEKNQLQAARLKIEVLSKRSADYKKKVEQLKEKWRRQVEFANALIAVKKTSVADQLGVIEEHLPEGVFITDVHLDTGPKGRLSVRIAADSLAKLSETYQSFADYRASFKDETEKEGFFRATLSLALGK